MRNRQGTNSGWCERQSAENAGKGQNIKMQGKDKWNWFFSVKW